VLDIKGGIVTLDAMGCQRAIAAKILEKEADYLVTLKANQERNSPLFRSFVPQPASAARPFIGRSMTNLMMAMVALFGAGCLSAPTPQCWNRCATGRA
jgi:hypothetical protein